MDYTHMMGEGEDLEEFTYRLISASSPEWGNELGNSLLIFNWYRAERLRGWITHEEYYGLLDSVIERVLAIRGEVEPSTEYVGYF